MKINVTKADEGWLPAGAKDALFTIYIEGMGEPQRTYDKALAVVGEHEAEEFTSKSGKKFWRTPRVPNPYQGRGGAKEFKADPLKQSSIEWQSSIKAAAEIVRDFKTLGGTMSPNPVVTTLDNYTMDVINVAIRIVKVVEMKPEQPFEDEEDVDI